MNMDMYVYRVTEKPDSESVGEPGEPFEAFNLSEAKRISTRRQQAKGSVLGLSVDRRAVPLLCGARAPSFVLAEINSRSICAASPRMVAVIVAGNDWSSTIRFLAMCTVTPRSAAACSNSSTWRVDRAKRETSAAISTSPASAVSSSRPISRSLQDLRPLVVSSTNSIGAMPCELQ